jgi:serine/threonine protein kinase
MVEKQIPPATPGDVYPLGKYIVLAELGRGGMAEVYLALSRGQSGFNKLVVLKLLRSHLAEDPEFLEMFLAEARLAARLNHANIVQTYEVGFEAGRHCIVMEYLEGRTLTELESATRSNPMPLSYGVRILAEALAALHYAHELCDVDGRPLGIVHRDVSPHNLVVTYDGQVKLLDFGIAKATQDDARTRTGVFKGKLRYTAPERLTTDVNDRRSDVFSVGVLLWQLLTRRHVWAGMNDLSVMQQLANRTRIPSPRSVVADVPKQLEQICLKALDPSPDARFQTAAEMEDALEEFLANESGGITNRTLAKFLGEVFGESRQSFQHVVDQQMRVAATLPLDTSADEGFSSPSESRSRLALRTSTPISMSPLGVTIDAQQPLDDSPATTPAPDAHGARRAWKVAAVGVLLTVAVATAGVVVTRMRVAQEPPSPATQAQTAAASSVETVQDPQTPAPSASSTSAPTASATSSPPRAAPVVAPGPARESSPRSQAPPPHVAAAPKAAAPAPAAESTCSPPYYLSNGIKTFKPQCL